MLYNAPQLASNLYKIVASFLPPLHDGKLIVALKMADDSFQKSNYIRNRYAHMRM